MGKYKEGDRVFDKDCREFGTVIGYCAGLVKVAYDQDNGCDTNIDYADENDLEDAS
ncbi:MAG: hypothetical protein LBI03_01695 [Clostridiales bacterium]|jgi:NADPH-dependent curcumin reductase CurA|nr:hypothetical protein [Clostridiales bacterium]